MTLNVFVIAMLSRFSVASHSNTLKCFNTVLLTQLLSMKKLIHLKVISTSNVTKIINFY